MSFEKTSDPLNTAEDLFQFLLSIPQPLREVLPLSVFIDNDKVENVLVEEPFYAQAYEVRETEGCLERGFRISSDE